MLLSECVLLTRTRLLIGIADGPLLAKKKLAELIEDIDVRCHNVKEFLEIVAPTLNVLTTPIFDPFGPSITEKDYQVKKFI
jgi:phosphopantetheine adenylyltransferase